MSISPPRLARCAVVTTALLCGAGCSEPGAPAPQDGTFAQNTRARLERVGHAVEDGATALKDGLENVGERVQGAVARLQPPPLPVPVRAAAPPASAAAAGPTVYEAPPMP